MLITCRGGKKVNPHKEIVFEISYPVPDINYCPLCKVLEDLDNAQTEIGLLTKELNGE